MDKLTKCEVCGSEVYLHQGDDGTNCYIPKAHAEKATVKWPEKHFMDWDDNEASFYCHECKVHSDTDCQYNKGRADTIAAYQEAAKGRECQECNGTGYRPPSIALECKSCLGTGEAAKVEGAGEELYPCADCGTLRTEAEGGTTFTVCDECWDKHYPPKVSPTATQEGAKVEEAGGKEPLKCPRCNYGFLVEAPVAAEDWETELEKVMPPPWSDVKRFIRSLLSRQPRKMTEDAVRDFKAWLWNEAHIDVTTPFAEKIIEKAAQFSTPIERVI